MWQVPSSGQVNIVAEDGVAKICTSAGVETTLGTRRLIGSATGDGTGNNLQVDVTDWQTIYKKIDLEISDVYCDVDAGIRFRINDNGSEAATPNTYNFIEHWDSNAGTPVVTETVPGVFRTDTSFNVNNVDGEGVVGEFRYISGGSTASSSFSILSDITWGQTSAVDGSWQRGHLVSGDTPTTSFDGFILDCSGSNNIHGEIRVYGINE